MYLTDRDIKWAIDTGDLIIDPRPDKIDSTSVDLHLGPVSEAKIWDVEAWEQQQKSGGNDLFLRIANYDLRAFGNQFLVEPPNHNSDDSDQKVSKRGPQIILKQGGFLLWTTRENVGTPSENADLICFVDGKSTRARAGIIVHFTAPTIHSSWVGKVTLEIANLGPFPLLLEAGDVIAQLTVARVTSPPERTMSVGSVTYMQRDVSGAPE